MEKRAVLEENTPWQLWKANKRGFCLLFSSTSSFMPKAHEGVSAISCHSVGFRCFLHSSQYIYHSINLFFSTSFSAKQKFGGPSASFLGSNSKPSNKCIEKFEPKIICALSISILYVWPNDPKDPSRNFQTLPQPDPILDLGGYYLIITYFLDRTIILWPYFAWMFYLSSIDSL